ncbi:MAG: FAD-binding oxidoreductase [Rhizobiaceae bacterium]|nr:MAG: FAD-binding oxidoreductase [Rhizobiaceae bacterium]CAG1000873.1 L-gulonolactone oxidase [Rhizobiaceae bacterium]
MAAHMQSFGLVGGPSPQVIDPAEGERRLRGRQAGINAVLAYGNGRSYGDSCLNGLGTLIDMRSRSQIIDFDPQSGLLKAEAGAMLSDIIALVGPQGFFPPVVPGTRFITLGGAIANDVHGKNHHRRGTFGGHVESLTLLRSDGVYYRCSPTQNVELFRATIGGLGLTGLILSAEVRMMKVASTDVDERVSRFRDLAEYFDIAQAADDENEYAVAWIDQLASGRSAGRGLLIAGNHATGREPVKGRGLPFRPLVPFRPPFSVIGRPFLRLFNGAYYWRKGASPDPHRASADTFFFPLDGVSHWNRLYGPRGLFQHQSVIPTEAARTAVAELLRVARDAGEGSFLTVLKRFGEMTSPGLLSFPRPGYTLTLDFPNRGEKTLSLLRELDHVTMAAGGAVNPYKDARMSAKVFAASFPGWQQLEARRDPAFVSDFWRRTAMRLPTSTSPVLMAG